MLLSALLKWVYHSKLYNVKKKIIIIQKKFRNFKNNNDVINNWAKLKNKINKITKWKEIQEIIHKLKINKSLNLIQNILLKKSGADAFNKFKCYIIFHNTCMLIKEKLEYR